MPVDEERRYAELLLRFCEIFVQKRKQRSARQRPRTDKEMKVVSAKRPMLLEYDWEAWLNLDDEVCKSKVMSWSSLMCMWGLRARVKPSWGVSNQTKEDEMPTVLPECSKILENGQEARVWSWKMQVRKQKKSTDLISCSCEACAQRRKGCCALQDAEQVKKDT